MTPTTTDGELAPMAVTVEIEDFAFVDADIRVAPGGTVTWVNQDSQQHTATGEGTFDTGAIGPGESVTVTFDDAGSFPYICSFHPFMTGTVTVG
jgi:plastocyanin